MIWVDTRGQESQQSVRLPNRMAGQGRAKLGLRGGGDRGDLEGDLEKVIWRGMRNKLAAAKQTAWLM